MEQIANTPAPTSGMFAPYVPPEIGEPLDTLREAQVFLLLKASVRDGIDTEHGKRSAVDLVVQTAKADATRLFSGFAAGIVGQAKRQAGDELPAVVKIVSTPTPRGATLSLELLDKPAPGADLAAIAASLPVPMMPVSAQTDVIPY